MKINVLHQYINQYFFTYLSILFNIIKKLSNMTINSIEFIIHRYYNKAINYVKQIIDKETSIDILIQNNNYHKYKF